MAEKHWGIWLNKAEGWMTFDSRNVFWTTSYAMAKAQLRDSSFVDDPQAEIRSFEDWDEALSKNIESKQARD